MMSESYPKAGIKLYQDRIGAILSVLTRVVRIPLNDAEIIVTYAVINPSTCFNSQKVLTSELKKVRLVLQTISPKRSSPRRNSTHTVKKKVTYYESKTEDSEDEMDTEDILDNELSSHNDDIDCGESFVLSIRCGKGNNDEDGPTTTGAIDSGVSGGQAKEGFHTMSNSAIADIGLVAVVGAPEETGKEQGFEISNSSDKKSESASEELRRMG